MSKSTLKKALQKMNAEGLINIILEAYAARKETKEYFEFWLNPDPKIEYDRSTQKLQKVFFSSPGKRVKRPRVSNATKIIKDFQSICKDPEYYGPLLLDLAYYYSQWLVGRYYVKTHRERIIKHFRSARDYIESTGLHDILERRLNDTEAVLRKIYPGSTI